MLGYLSCPEILLHLFERPWCVVYHLTAQIQILLAKLSWLVMQVTVSIASVARHATWVDREVREAYVVQYAYRANLLKVGQVFLGVKDVVVAAQHAQMARKALEKGQKLSVDHHVAHQVQMILGLHEAVTVVKQHLVHVAYGLEVT